MSEIDIIKNKFNAKNQWALVVGDLMLDRYLIGSVSRISPEAPVPVVRLKESFDRIGGSGNVAANLAQLGIKTILAGQIGDDGDGKKLLDILKKKSYWCRWYCQRQESHNYKNTDYWRTSTNDEN